MEKIYGTHKRHVLSASTLAGDSVVNSRGEDLGKIQELMIDLDSGKVAYAVLSFGGIAGIGSKLFAVPLDILAIDEDKKRFILDVDKKRLQSSSGFDKNHWPDTADMEFWNNIKTTSGSEEVAASIPDEYIYTEDLYRDQCAHLGIC